MHIIDPSEITLGVKSARSSHTMGTKQHRTPHTLGVQTHMVFANMNNKNTMNGHKPAVEEHKTLSINTPTGLSRNSEVHGKGHKKSSLERKRR
jgi:hypothetical protein